MQAHPNTKLQRSFSTKSMDLQSTFTPWASRLSSSCTTGHPILGRTESRFALYSKIKLTRFSLTSGERSQAGPSTQPSLWQVCSRASQSPGWGTSGALTRSKCTSGSMGSTGRLWRRDACRLLSSRAPTVTIFAPRTPKSLLERKNCKKYFKRSRYKRSRITIISLETFTMIKMTSNKRNRGHRKTE